MDFYIVLGVDRSAGINDIKKAYKRLARRLHPDINPGDREAEARFRQVLDAYETLMDPDRRRRYDAGQLSVGTADDDANQYSDKKTRHSYLVADGAGEAFAAGAVLELTDA